MTNAVTTPAMATADFSLLSGCQKSVIKAFEAGKNIFVTGGAGSGKSHLLNFLKRNYEQHGLAVTASTGIAAVNIGGVTIHSWAGIGLATLSVEQIVENIFSARFIRARRKIKRAHALAIDEISMISDQVLEILDRVFRLVRENNSPMGGLQILFFGDFLQLPPIRRSGENFNFCFGAKVWKELDLEIFVLEEIFRQSDQKFIKILNNLRFGKFDENDRKALESRLKAKDNNSVIRPTILTTHNSRVEKINLAELQKIPCEEITHIAEYSGVPEKIEFLKKNCMAAQSLKLKVGAQVMMVKNTYQKEGIINGSLGIIRNFSPKKLYPLVEFANGKILTIVPQEWVIERYDDEKKLMVTDAKVNQVPLILAWAITIHKSQGLTLDKISCDLSDIFSPGQAYVALSRVRCLEGLFINSINFNRITSDQEAVSFYNNLK
jgi:ATP-dependent exoDNAse (exonuclease V) alpha subunit